MNYDVTKYLYKDYKIFSDIRELITYAADSYSDNPAYCFKVNGEYAEKTFKEFLNEVTNLSSYFVKVGYVGEKVAIVGEPSYSWIATFIAIMNAGAVAVPLDKGLSDDDLVSKTEFADSVALIYGKGYESVSKNCPDTIKCISLSEIEKELVNDSNAENVELPPLNSQDVAMIAYTSGTTSMGKGVMLTQKNVVSNAPCAAAVSDFIGGRILLISPLNHLNGICQLMISLYGGDTVAINESIKYFMQNMKYYKPTLVMVVPMIVNSFYREIHKNLREKNKLKTVNIMRKICRFLRCFGIDIRRKVFSEILEVFGGNLGTLIVGGAYMDPEKIRFFDDIGINILEGYGVTECSPTVSVNLMKKRRIGSIGCILPHNDVRISDEGEIQVKGINVMKGYYKDEEATKEAFDGEWFKTGDLGSIDKDGFLYITGRIKNLIILPNGENVSPEVLEQHVERISVVREVLVKESDGKICAEVFLDDSLDLTKEEMKKILKNSIEEINKALPSHHHIQKIEIRDQEFEKNVLSKIKRKQVKN